jgi:glutamine amidotransferase
MCRLFAMSAGAERARATFWLLDAPDSLSVQSYREPDGTGLGWFDARGRPCLRKQPIAAYGDTAFAREAREVRSRTFLAHIRFASTGGLTDANTHPFEQEGRLFAHNGVVEDLPALERRLGPARALVHGETDSERLFALITSEIAAAGGDVGAGIRAACKWVAETLPVLSINFVLATAEGLWALRYPETHELFVLQRDAGAPLEHRSPRFGTRVRAEDGASAPLVTVATERMDADRGWRPLASGELLHVGPALQVTRTRILSGSPAHPLTLADLSPRAASSQAPAAT